MSGQEGAGGDVEIRRMALRREGWIGYSADSVFVDEGDEKIRIDNEAVEQLSLRWMEWDLVVMSLVLVAVGGYVFATRNPYVGVGFVVVGLASLYRSYRKRYELEIRIANQPKPVRVYPEHPTECHETLVAQLGLR